MRSSCCGSRYLPRLMSSSMAAAYSSASRSLAKFRDFWTRLPSRSVYQRHLHREPWPYSADRHLPGTLAFIGSFALASDCFAALLGGLPSSSFLSHLSSTNALAMVVSFRGSALHCAWNLILVKPEMLIVGSLGSVRLCSGGTLFCFPSRYVDAELLLLHAHAGIVQQLPIVRQYLDGDAQFHGHHPRIALVHRLRHAVIHR